MGNIHFGAKFLTGYVNITIGLHFSPSAGGTEIKFRFYVVGDTNNAHAKCVR